MCHAVFSHLAMIVMAAGQPVAPTGVRVEGIESGVFTIPANTKIQLDQVKTDDGPRIRVKFGDAMLEAKKLCVKKDGRIITVTAGSEKGFEVLTHVDPDAPPPPQDDPRHIEPPPPVGKRSKER